MANDTSSNHQDLHMEYGVGSNGNDKKCLPTGEPSDTAGEIDSTIKKKGKSKHRAVTEKTKTLTNPYKCQYCENSYPNKVKYDIHIRMHRQDRPFECEICDKRFSTTPQLSRHMNSHTGNRPYKCKFCDSCFGDPSTRIKHQRIHTKERPYKCELCSKSFAYTNVLKDHMLVHTGEKPYGCSYCDKSFTLIHHKKTHEKRHRKAVNLDVDEPDVIIKDELGEYGFEIIYLKE